jgi:hypothetical protein
MSAMANDLNQRFGGTRWIGNKKPVLTQLIVDSESVVRKLEVYPRLRNVIRNEIGNFGAIEGSNVIAENGPRSDLRK